MPLAATLDFPFRLNIIYSWFWFPATFSTTGTPPVQPSCLIYFSSANLQVISDPDRRVLCAMVKSLDRNVEYIVDALKEQVSMCRGKQSDQYCIGREVISTPTKVVFDQLPAKATG